MKCMSNTRRPCEKPASCFLLVVTKVTCGYRMLLVWDSNFTFEGANCTLSEGT